MKCVIKIIIDYILAIFYKCLICYDFRNPNSSDLNLVWNNTNVDNPKYLSIDGDNTCMVDGLINASSVHFWENIFKIIQLKQKL